MGYKTYGGTSIFFSLAGIFFSLLIAVPILGYWLSVFIFFYLGVGSLCFFISLATGISSSYYTSAKIGIVLSCIGLMGLIAVALHAFVFYERPPVIPDY